MMYLGNSPSHATVLRVEARKSFALGLHLYDGRGREANLSGCTLTIVAKAVTNNDSDATNLLAANAIANIPVPSAGYAVFNLQAITMDLEVREYDYAIVLRTAEGYSSVIVKGVIDVQANTEWSSVGTTYTSVNPPSSLQVLLTESNTIQVFIGGQLPPGMNYIRDDTLGIVEGFDPDSIALVPPGGLPGYVLSRTGAADYEFGWLPLGQGPYGLDATAVPDGFIPTATGNDTWIWKGVGLDAAGITAGWAPVANGAGGWAWAQVTTPPSDWAAAVATPGHILNKPLLGTAAATAATAYMAATTRVHTMPGITFQTTIPVSGTEGQIYFVYTA